MGLCVLSIVTLGIVVLTIESNKKLRGTTPNLTKQQFCWIDRERKLLDSPLAMGKTILFTALNKNPKL